jgi:uncharacterized protein DUF6600
MRKYGFTFATLITLALLALFLAPPRAAAQGDGDDPPSRVARLSFVRGSVSFQPAGTDDWVDAFVNRPMTTGDKLWSDSGSRAALHIGSASIHLSQNTGFSFLNLTDDTAQLQLTSGTLRVRVKRLGDEENFEIDTPNLAFTILRPGIYKISVNDSGDTTVIEDIKGEGEVTGGGSAYTVHSGDWDTFSGTDYLSANQDVIDDDDSFNDDFEQWSEQRDHHEDVSISAQYVSDDAIGYDDLDDNGGWRPVPEYGNVWFPHTAQVGWAPYHYGHWAYVAPWGYTWVDDAAWGFAPFHYGRWVTVGGAWGWVPCAPRPAVVVYGGPVYVRPVYAPALVAWVGGAGFSVGVGGGFGAGVNVAWFPLGPREVYVPSYPVSRAYVTNVNISNTRVETTVVNNYYTNVVINKNVTVTNVTYVNQRVPGAVVATSGAAFTSGGSVSRNVVQVDARVVASAPVAAVTPPAVPQRAAFTGGRVTATVHPPAAIQARTVVAKTAPPPPPPPVAQRVQAIQQNGGRPLSVAQTRQIVPVRTAAVAAPAVKVAPPAKAVAPKVIKANTTPQPPPSTNRAAANIPKNPPPAATNNVAPSNNRPPANGQPNGQPGNNGRPAANTQPPANTPANNNRPPAQQQPAANTQVARPAPPTAHPADEQLEQQHTQQLNNLHNQQDQERQQLEQKQNQERQQLADQKAAQAKQQQQQQQQAQQKQQQEEQQAKQKADEQRQQQLNQQHQQQLEQLQQKHQQEQQQLQQKQEQEHKQAQQAKPQEKPKDKPKDDRPPKKDR